MGNWSNTASSPGAMNSNTLPVSIGMRGNGWHELIGDIDHIGYWSRALTGDRGARFPCDGSDPSRGMHGSYRMQL